MSIARVGVEAFVEDPAEREERLLRIQRLDIESAGPGYAMTDADIETSLAQAQAAGSLEIRFREFAELSDGRLVLTTGDAAGISIHLAMAMQVDSVPTESALDDIADWVEQDVERALRQDLLDPDWHLLLAALRQNGIAASLEELSELPHSVRIDSTSIRAWIARTVN